MPALIFTAQAVHENEQRQVRRFGSVLGTYWSRETVEGLFSKGTGRRKQRLEEMSIPLLLGINPKIQDFLRDSFGSSVGISAPEWYQTEAAEHRGEIVEGWDMSREEFVKLAGLFTGLIPRDYYQPR